LGGLVDAIAIMHKSKVALVSRGAASIPKHTEWHPLLGNLSTHVPAPESLGVPPDERFSGAGAMEEGGGRERERERARVCWRVVSCLNN